MEKEQAKKGALHEMLAEMDAETAERLHPNDTKRIVRALEICIKSGKKASEQGKGFTYRNDDALEFTPVMAGITMPRDMLYARIEKRVDDMFNAGLVDEVRALLSRGCTRDCRQCRALDTKKRLHT